MALGLQRPVRGWFGWLADPHLLVAALVAAPVLGVLALTAGHRMAAPAGAMALLSLVLLQPVAEELLFRGLVQGWLLRALSAHRTQPVTLANLVTTIAFCALHLAAQPPAWALAVAVPSLVFGHLRERLDSVLPAMALHAFYNAGFALAACWVHR